jgi:hypothetical protein
VALTSSLTSYSNPSRILPHSPPSPHFLPSIHPTSLTPSRFLSHGHTPSFLSSPILSRPSRTQQQQHNRIYPAPQARHCRSVPCNASFTYSTACIAVLPLLHLVSISPSPTRGQIAKNTSAVKPRLNIAPETLVEREWRFGITIFVIHLALCPLKICAARYRSGPPFPTRWRVRADWVLRGANRPMGVDCTVV